MRRWMARMWMKTMTRGEVDDDDDDEEEEDM